MRRSQSAGGVVIGPDGRVLVTNQNGDSWSLPKGHIDPGEDARTAAARETAEETGITQLTYVKDLGSYERYRTGKGGKGEDKSDLKTIIMFLYTTKETDLQPTDEHNPEAQWVVLEEVANLLTNPKDKAFFESVIDQVTEVIASNS